MREVALIRHGLPNRVEGVAKPDPGLTEVGAEQARAVATAMVLLPVRAVASSGLLRARETAAPTAEQLGLMTDIHDDLAEFDNGEDFYVPIEDMIAEADPRLEQWRQSLADPAMQTVLAEFRRLATDAVARVAAANPRRLRDLLPWRGDRRLPGKGTGQGHSAAHRTGLWIDHPHHHHTRRAMEAADVQ